MSKKPFNVEVNPNSGSDENIGLITGLSIVKGLIENHTKSFSEQQRIDDSILICTSLEGILDKVEQSSYSINRIIKEDLGLSTPGDLLVFILLASRFDLFLRIGELFCVNIEQLPNDSDVSLRQVELLELLPFFHSSSLENIQDLNLDTDSKKKFLHLFTNLYNLVMDELDTSMQPYDETQSYLNKTLVFFQGIIGKLQIES